MPDRTPWWPLRWEEVETLRSWKHGWHKRQQSIHTGLVNTEANVRLPNGRRFLVLDRTEVGGGYVLNAVDEWGVTNYTPTERVPDLISLRCFLQAEADA